MKKTSSLFLGIALLLLLCYGFDGIRYSEMALTIWFENLIPSMFVSMVLIRTMYKQQVFTHLCPRWLCHIFHVQPQEMALFLSSLLLGFPNGSILIDEAYATKRISASSAKRLFLICSFPTPGFVILTCGMTLFHNARFGFLLYASQVLYGILALLCSRSQDKEVCPCIVRQSNPLMHDLRTSIMESGIALFMMGGYLMVFMSISALLLAFLPSALALPLRILSEFSSGVFLIQTTTFSLTTCLYATGALLGFGGLCVHMQIYAMCEHRLVGYLTFFLMRILQAITSLFFFYLLCLFFG